MAFFSSQGDFLQQTAIQSNGNFLCQKMPDGMGGANTPVTARSVGTTYTALCSRQGSFVQISAKAALCAGKALMAWYVCVSYTASCSNQGNFIHTSAKAALSTQHLPDVKGLIVLIVASLMILITTSVEEGC